MQSRLIDNGGRNTRIFPTLQLIKQVLEVSKLTVQSLTRLPIFKDKFDFTQVLKYAIV